MQNEYVQAIIAGVFFGIWPLFMHRSGIEGNSSAMVFSLGTMVIVVPFVLLSTKGVVESILVAKWAMVAGACITSAAGVIFFTNMLAKAPVHMVSSLFVLMIVAQIVVPSVYQTFVSESIPPQRLVGFAGAAFSAYLLIKY